MKASAKPSAETQAKGIRSILGQSWLPDIYRNRILSQRTRSYHFATSKPGSRVEIQHTLLGVELKIGRRRLSCPDLATARYLSVFARVGCSAVAVPYDISRVSLIADELESSWQRMLLLADEQALSLTSALKLRRLLTGWVRDEVQVAGAGPAVPEFKQSTRQRNPRVKI